MLLDGVEPVTGTIVNDVFLEADKIITW